MTPREHALLLRLCAAELTHEERSIIVLRRILGELGWGDTAIDLAVAEITRAVVGLYRQADLFERAA